jgi:hypothetical protein
MDLEEFQHLYPAFQLEDELLVQGGRDVMWRLSYMRSQAKEGNQQPGSHAKEGVQEGN